MLLEPFVPCSWLRTVMAMSLVPHSVSAFRSWTLSASFQQKRTDPATKIIRPINMPPTVPDILLGDGEAKNETGAHGNGASMKLGERACLW